MFVSLLLQGFAANDPTILHFWDVTLSMQREMQKKLLHFCTGSDRVPVGGMQDLKFKIIRAPTAQNMYVLLFQSFPITFREKHLIWEYFFPWFV